MLLPKLSDLKTQRTAVQRFAGYQHVDAPAAGAFFHTHNLSAARCPALAPRPPRQKVAGVTDPKAFAAKDKLAWVAGDALYYDGVAAAELTPGGGERQLVSMGAWLIVWPDGVRYNTRTGAVDSLSNTVTASAVTVGLCLADGEALTGCYTGGEAPDPTQYDYWLCTADTPHTLRVWNTDVSAWVSLSATYLSLQAEGIGAGFAAGDTVIVSGAARSELNGDHALVQVQPDAVVFAGILDETGTEETLTLGRKLPRMDFLTECGNRLWGCSSADNELYACKLGDPTNWYSYNGASADSYAATVGTDGAFTGAVTYLGYVLFFKQNCIHKVYGSKPANFQISQTDCRGVQAGSEKSLAAVAGTLYYKSTDGICRYDGGLPERVDAALGDVAYHGAVGGASAGRYYVSMADAAGQRSLFCYAPDTGVWAREDDADALAFAELDGMGYLLCKDGGLWRLEAPSDAGTTDGPVEWSAETGPLHADGGAQYLTRLEVRLWLPQGSVFRAEVQYDSSPWQTLAVLQAPADQTLRLPLTLRRCDHVRLRLSGTGPCRVDSLTRECRAGREAVRYAGLE